MSDESHSDPAPHSESEATHRLERVESPRISTPNGLEGAARVQFAPGDLIGGRYRIVSLLGKGGMGEVFRADDIKLGQTVALKFLPAHLAEDPQSLAQLHQEVRLGRQVSHPNVCRLFDIGEWQGQHFVSMEYIGGEDLASLLLRIGRVPADKANEMARGLCDGLSAAHACGVLHRDLKPANVMLDGKGEVRITDFGLAAVEHEAGRDGVIAGTPAYMAPEQLDGKPATIRTDIYALGILLYEIYTGKKPFSGKTLREVRESRSGRIVSARTLAQDIDPAVEEVIRRCLSPDPAQRPASARAVAEALPGGDRLAAARAAGETLSPELVAAAGADIGIAPALVWTLIALSVACVAGFLLMVKSGGRLTELVPFEKPPSVLAERAREIRLSLGLRSQRVVGRGYWFDGSYLRYINETDSSIDRWKRLSQGPPVAFYWLREAPGPLERGDERVSMNEPALGEGETLIVIDTLGRLASLTAIPAGGLPLPATTPDWPKLFQAAGLEPSRFVPAQPGDIPPSFADARVAFTGTRPLDPGIPLRVEAAAYRGMPVFFSIAAPWNDRARKLGALPFSGSALRRFVTLLGAAALSIAALLAWKNLRHDRVDRVGANRIAIGFLLLTAPLAIVLAPHTGEMAFELNVASGILGRALLQAAVVWVLYIALEPVVRRRWPELLISWTRLLRGRLDDPIVGRDVLIGVTAGTAHAFLAQASNTFAPRLGAPGFGVPRIPHTEMLDGISGALNCLVANMAGDLQFALICIFLLALFALVFKRRLAAALVLAGIQMLGYYLAIGRFVPWLFTVAITALVVVVAARFGLLAIVALMVAFRMTFASPITLDPKVVYFPQGFLILLLLAGIVFVSARRAANRPLIPLHLLD
ncbi:MAG: serine/threonine-protein kinase [Thermoanaerobaculia bacterium]